MIDTSALGAHKASVQAHFDRLAPEMPRWRRKSWYYHRDIERLCRRLIPAGASVLDIGCGTGELLAAVAPREGVGVDLSPAMVEQARARFPNLEWHVGDAEALDFGGRTFDYIILSDLVGHLEDIWAAFQRLKPLARPDTRIIVTYYNYFWEPLLHAAEAVGQRMPLKLQNWLPLEDLSNLLYLCDFEVIKRGRRFLVPKYVPLISEPINRIAGAIPGVRRLCLIEYLVARPWAAQIPVSGGTSSSVIVPCRNERGNVEAAIERLPALGPATELIFVDGASTDGTVEEIERQNERWKGKKDIRLILQPNPKGKGEAVRLGFDAARHDILFILDADLTVAPEDLPKFHQAIVDSKGEMINGSRLVYPMESQAMRFLNLLGNKFFSMLFTWMLEQRITDTLCGTKVLRKRDYESIKANRAYFGDFDPFGDFDLLFGAARLNLKICDLPVRYRDRTYGTTKISRFRHGLLLFKMSWIAFRKLKLG